MVKNEPKNLNPDARRGQDPDQKRRDKGTPVEEIFDLMQKHPEKEEQEFITRAYNFAQSAHAGQRRYSGDPYFVHLFEVAKNLAKLGMDTKTIAAGLLHDTLEDTPITKRELEEHFGEDVAFLVKGVSKLGILKYQERERHIKSLRRFFMAMAKDVRVIIIKLIDRLHNIQTLQYVPEEKRKRIAVETIEIHAPLADRLGIWRLKAELEDYAFPYAFPEDYKIVEELLKKKNPISKSKKRLEGVYKKLTKEIAAQGIMDAKTDYRIKNKYSLWKKLQRKEMDIEKVYDLVALRVIVTTIEDCYQVLGIIHGLWKPVPGRIKDYIASTKPNGYQGLHTTIFTGYGDVAEIQIRTKAMNTEAEYGIASHFLYKKGVEIKHPQTLAKRFKWLKYLKDLREDVNEPAKFLEHLKIDLFEDRIFVFTPKGDVVDLPRDSCPIDFAYNIHTYLGNHTSGSKINGKFSSLDSKLKNGDIIEIITKKNSHPTVKWINYTKTALAKRQIQKHLSEITTERR